ncbi:MAG TPA: hypothetical protein VI386_36770 [Candidatus Sulfotelmatobacter sp.]
MQRTAFAALLLALGFAPACSHSSASVNQGADDSASANQSQIPFHEADSPSSLTPDGGDRLSPAKVGSDNSDVPFAGAATGILSAGSLLTVRLAETLAQKWSGETAESATLFNAVLEYPIAINGDLVIPRGAVFLGRIEAVRILPTISGRANIRLTLYSIHTGGRDIPLQTSSLFVRGRSSLPPVRLNAVSPGPAARLEAAVDSAENENDNNKDRMVQIQKGRLLTFRLASPVSLPVSVAGHSSYPSSSKTD